MVRSTLAHAQTNYHVSQFVHWIKEKLTCSQIGKQMTFHWDLTSKITVCVSICPQAQQPSPCLCPNPKSIWSIAGGSTQGSKFTGSTGFPFSNIDESGFLAGSRLGMLMFHCGFTEPSLIWLLPGRDVPCSMCDILRTMSRHSVSSPNIVGTGAAASSAVCGWTTAGTLNSDLLYFLSVSRK